ncbi:MAG: C39 family peptidase [Anaerolineaceae bacterium]|nr:C39 family peptidase [Anaerolineaceae bacterium]HNX45846.1 C39 family peptidase [Anaerolineaceae bacterium]HPT24072.1 C39 family peptidase [Anaerolineaceae bacterium]
MTDPKKTFKKQLSQTSPWRKPWIYLGLVLLAGLVLLGLYQVPFVHDRASIYVNNLNAKIYYWLHPPTENVFGPAQQGTVSAQVVATLTAMAPSATPVLPTNTPQPDQTEVATDVPEPTKTPFPVPAVWKIDGMGLEYQTFNNCGPANLSMYVTYWGWPTVQSLTEAKLKTQADDRNVMLTEMLDYVRANTNLDGVIRYGGDMDVLRRLVAGGFPVLFERGHTDPKNGWMGHYGIVTAYDDATQTVTIPDTLLGMVTISYDELLQDWAHFDGIYLVVYPQDRQAEVMSLLGDEADPVENLKHALDKVNARVEQATGRELFFALYSRGSLLVLLQDYVAAAQSYDQAFNLYAQLPAGERPWRVTWYLVGPYEAYYYTGRYQDVVTLAQQTLDNTNLDSLPETWLWAGKAAAMLGEKEKAIDYLQGALEWYPNWDLALAELAKLQ